MQFVFNLDSEDNFDLLKEVVSFEDNLSIEEYIKNPCCLTKEKISCKDNYNVNHFRCEILNSEKVENNELCFKKLIEKKDIFNFKNELSISFNPLCDFFSSVEEYFDNDKELISLINKKNIGDFVFVFKTDNPLFQIFFIYLADIFKGDVLKILKLMLNNDDIFNCAEIKNELLNFLSLMTSPKTTFVNEIKETKEKLFYSISSLIEMGLFENLSGDVDIFCNLEKNEMLSFNLNYKKNEKKYNKGFSFDKINFSFDNENGFFLNEVVFNKTNSTKEFNFYSFYYNILKEEYFLKGEELFNFDIRNEAKYTDNNLCNPKDLLFSLVKNTPVDDECLGIYLPPVFKRFGFEKKIMFNKNKSNIKTIENINNDLFFKKIDKKYFNLFFYIMHHENFFVASKLNYFLNLHFNDWKENGLNEDEINFLFVSNPKFETVYHVAKKLGLLFKELKKFIINNKVKLLSGDDETVSELIKILTFSRIKNEQTI